MGIDEQGVIYFVKDAVTRQKLGHLACILHQNAVYPSGITKDVARMWEDFLLRDVPIKLIDPQTKKGESSNPPLSEEDATLRQQFEDPSVFEAA